MSRIRIALIACAMTAVAFGAALAKEPPDGEGWIEYTYYNASGVAIGGRWKDCTGHIATWGASHGARTEITTGPCP